MSSAPEIVVRLVAVSAGYRAGFHLHEIDFALPAGARCAVLGANGCGKSTLLRLLGGLLIPHLGTLELWSRPAADWTAAERAKRVAGLPAELDMPLPLTVREFVSLGRAPHVSAWSPPSREETAAIDQALQALDLSALADARLDRISAGERQRAGLALVLAQRPDLLLLDEPTAHLDLRHAVQFFSALTRLAGTRPLTTVFSTHDLQLAADAATHILLLKQGRILASGPTADVLNGPRLTEAFDTPIDVREEGGQRWVRKKMGVGKEEMGDRK
jgi:iron complex transport system ATP-binding protein